MKPPAFMSLKTLHPLPPTAVGAARSRAQILSWAHSRGGTARACAMLLAALLLVLCSGLAQAGSFLEEGFAGTALDTTKWAWQDRNWPVGQTWFVGSPTVSGGVARYHHHTYNPYDTAHNSCWSQEIYSLQAFGPPQPGELLEFVARVKVVNETPQLLDRGQVTSFFLYMDKSVGGHLESDEIDYEYLTNQINTPPESGGHRTWNTTYNDFHGQWGDPRYYWSENPQATGLNLTQFNWFKITWQEHKVQWFWSDKGAGLDPDDQAADHMPGKDEWNLLSETPYISPYAQHDAVPDEGMTLRFNFWAATSVWPEAWDRDMAVSDPSQDRITYYDVDYVRVTPEPATVGLLTLGGLALLRRRNAASVG